MAGTTTLMPLAPVTGAWRDGLRRLVPAWRMRTPERRRTVAATLPPLDFHAEAGAPEGALYIDGMLFGRCDAR